MDFFEHQDKARRRTGRLIWFLALAVVGIIAALYLVVWFGMMLVAGYDARPGDPNAYAGSFWHPELFLIVAAGTLAVILLSSLYKTAQLASGGHAVAVLLGARRIDPQTHEPAERRLLNVVEEMALAAGMPVPPVYMMDAEAGINAFAAGHDPRDAVIGVTHGCLKYLDRDELQGVIAHEFSHILNGDMRLNLRLVGILYGILVLALIGRIVLRSMRHVGRSRSRSGGGAVVVMAILGVGLVVIGSIGFFFARAIKSAVARQREYLADASAVQFTRLPDGIAGALKKIGGRGETSEVHNQNAEEISHMFFGNAFGSFSRRIFDPPPPLADRIKRIDPRFDGKFPARVEPVAVSAALLEAETKRARPPARVFGAVLGGAAAAIAVDPAAVLGRIGVPGLEDMLLSAEMLAAIPPPLREAAREPYDARAVVYAVLLDRDPAMRGRQLETLRTMAGERVRQTTEGLAPLIDGLPEEARLALIDTTFPALSLLSPAQYLAFRQDVDRLIHADDKVELMEYAVRSMVLRNLDVHFGMAQPPAARHGRLAPLLPALIRVLSALAHAGQSDAAEVRRAFDAGMARVGQTGAPLPREQCALDDVDAALGELAEAEPLLKRRILGACMACVAVDGMVTPREATLLRAVAAVLGVPISPLAAPGGETPPA